MALASTFSFVTGDSNGTAESSTTETIINRLSRATERGQGAAVPDPWCGTRRCGWDTRSMWSWYGVWLGNVCGTTVLTVITTKTLNLRVAEKQHGQRGL